MYKLLHANENARKQHTAVRTTAGWYYFTHHIVEVTGSDAAKLLDYLYTNDIANLGIGRARYTLMLCEDGISQDDCIIFRIAEQTYWVSTLHRPRVLKALADNKGELDVEFRSLTEEIDMYAVQGPRSAELVNAVVKEPVNDYKFFSIHDNMLGDLPVKVAKAGYSGETGYEIYVSVEDNEKVAEALRAHQDEFGCIEVTEVDVMAYTLATESGLVLVTDIDHEFPFESGMDRYIKWDKEFLGKEALENAQDKPASNQLVAFTVDQRDARLHGGPFGAPVLKDGKKIGHATKYTYGFTVEKGVGYALVEADSVAPGDQIVLNHDTVGVICEMPILKR